jgi:hypothetical protein
MGVTDLDLAFSPDNFHPDAVAHASKGTPESLEWSELLLRSIVEFQRRDALAVEVCTTRYLAGGPEGWLLYVPLTLNLWVAAHRHDQAAFNTAVAQWLAGRHRFPTNWNDDILQAREFASMTVPASLPDPPKPKPRPLGKKLLAAAPTLIERAVADNWEWIEPLVKSESQGAVAQRYRLMAYSPALRECTATTDDEADEGAPDITIAVTTRHGYRHSFLSH